MESLYNNLDKAIGKEIIISYYSYSRKIKTKKLKLISLRNFDNPSCMHMIVCNKTMLVDMYFFSPSSLIQSITLPEENITLFYNPFIESFFNRQYIDFSLLAKDVEKKFLQSIPSEQIVSEKDKFLLKYKKRGKFDFDELFFSEKQRQEFDAFFSLLIADLTRQAKRHNLDAKMKLIDKGTTSLIYSIGDKIVKIGKGRDNDVIPYCEYLLQPALNQEMLFDNIPMRIEVTEKVIAYKNLDPETQKQLHSKFEFAVIELRKKLKKIGLSCHDLNIFNIGILTKDNTMHFDTIPLQVACEQSTSIKNNNGLQVLKKGEFVILDLDAIEIVNYKKYCNYLRQIGYIIDKESLKTEDYGRQLTMKYVD